MKLTACVTVLIMWSIFKALPHNDSWCMMQWYAVSSPGPFTSSIFSRILLTNPFFWPHTAGAPSVVSPTSLSQGRPILFTHFHTSSKRSFPVVVPCIDFSPKSSSVTRRLESTPRMKIDSWAVSDVSVLSSTVREYAMNCFPFSVSCCFQLVESSHTRSATVFLLRLTFKKACLLSLHTTSQTFNKQFLEILPR